MKKKILSLLLALVMLAGLLPGSAFAENEAEPAAVPESAAEGAQPALTALEGEEPDAQAEEGGNDWSAYTGNIGRKAKFNLMYSNFPVVSAPQSVTDIWDMSINISSNSIPEDLVVVISDCYVDENIGVYWYLVQAAEGYSLPAAFPSPAWVYQNNLGTSDGDSLVFLAQCPICGAVNCSTEHKKCDTCGEYDCEEEHIPAVSGSVNGQTVTVSGLELPADAKLSLTAYDSSLLGTQGIMDITVLNADGSHWQPAVGQSVTVTVPAYSPSGYVDVLHFIDYAPAIGANTGYVSVEGIGSELAALLAPAIAASGRDGYVAYELIEKVPVINGTASFQSSGFSIYTWSGSVFTPIGSGNSTSVTFNNKIGGDSSNTIVAEYYATSDHLFTLTASDIVSVTDCAFSVIDSVTLNGTTYQTTVDGVVRRVNKEGFWTRHSATFTIPATAAPGETILLRFKGSTFIFYMLIHIVDLVDVSYESPSVEASNMPQNAVDVVTDGDAGKNIYTIPGTIPVPADAHYRFTGWNTSPDGTGDSFSWNGTAFSPAAFTPMRDTTLYAMWYNENSIVNFDPNGGSGVYEQQAVVTGSKISLPAAPVREDYKFMGWSASKDGYSALYAAGAEYTVNQDTILYAIWGVDLIVAVNGSGTLELQQKGEFSPAALEDAKYADGSAIFTKSGSGSELTYRATLLEGFLKEARFTFSYNSSTHNASAVSSDESVIDISTQSGKVYADVSANGVTKNSTITFTAVEKGKISYTVSYDTDNGSSIPATVLQGREGDTLRLTALPGSADTSKAGHSLEGWYSDAGRTQKVTAPLTVTANITLYAKWTPNTYNVNWIIDGVSREESYSFGQLILKPADPAKTGHSFTGWSGYTDGMTMPAGDVSFTAQWKLNEYTISFNTVGGSAIAPITLPYGSDVTAPADPTKTGHSFSGWDKSMPATMPAENMTLTAIWQVNTYTVTWYDGTGGIVGVRELEYEAAIEYPAEPTRAGYIFAGWDKSIATMPAEDVGINAVWSLSISASIDHGGMIDAVFGESSVSQQGAWSIGPVFEGTAPGAVITFRPAENYEISRVEINGLEQSFTLNSNGYYVLTLENGAKAEYARIEVFTTLICYELVIATNNTADSNQNYIFNISGTAVDGSSISVTVALAAVDSKTIVGLPAGSYTVTEKQGWNWRYTAQSKTVNISLTDGAPAAQIFTASTIINPRWLSGYGKELLPNILGLFKSK